METYKFLYFSIYILMTFFVLMDQLYPINDKKEKILIYIFGVLFLILFGLRDFSVGTDTVNYIEIIENLDKFYLFQGNDIGFIAVAATIYFTTHSVQAVFFIVACFYMIPIIKLFTTINIENKFLIFYTLVTLFSFEALGMNIIRQGVAIAFSLLAFNYHNENKLKNAILLIVIALSFHASTILFVAFYIVSLFIKNPKIPLLILIISSVLSITNFDIEPLLNLVPFLGADYEDRIVNYNDLDNSFGEVYETGFRLDFFLFNWMFVVIGLLMYYFNYAKNYKFYLPVLNTFMFTSSFFFLKFNQIFSDRFGVFAWILIPFIFAPIADNKIIYGKFYTFLLCLILFLLFKLNT